MRLLLLCHGFNSLTQRLFTELREAGHSVSVEFDINEAVTEQAVDLFRPDLLIAPFLKRAIPETVWRRLPCLVVHPGPPGDRGPAALDWAILRGERQWGVTVLQAVAALDAGPVWASESFPLRPDAPKSSLYRREVTEAAVRAVLRALDHPPPQTPPPGQWNGPVPAALRRIDWAADETATVLRKIHAADGVPGVRDEINGQPVRLFTASAAAAELSGPPGALLARSASGALCRATTDGAVWIGHLKAETPQALKLPAASVLDLSALPLLPGPPEVWYEEDGPVGFLHFPFHNGAMSAEQCQALQKAFEEATQRPTNTLVLMGGPEFWSNGIHLTVIEAADSPAEESWRSINAMNDLCRAVITCTSHRTIAALRGNAGAGGVFLALAADHVWARRGVVLNPHYKGMGNLYGSEYWTYLLPRRCGPERAGAVTQARLPMGTAEALRLGLIDEAFTEFDATVRARAAALSADTAAFLAEKAARRAADEAVKPLESYRAEELEKMRLNFFGFDPSYHVARYSFVHKRPKSRTPLFLAGHRRLAAGLE